MEKKFFTQSEKMSQEYCCTVVRLGEILEIPGANTVAKTLVNGRTIVIGKDHKPGDVMIYCSNESQLNFDFLSVNNLFSHVDKNCNAEEVNKWLEEHADAPDEEVKEYLRTHRGYFEDKGRVKMTKLAGEVSMGVLFELEQFKKWCPMLDVNLEELVGLDFDTVNDVLFIKAYMPETADDSEHHTGEGDPGPVLKYNRMLPGHFAKHYDTQLFEKVVHRFNPDDVVTISNKLHGTSYIIGNIWSKVIVPSWLPENWFLHLPKRLQFTKEGHTVIYSSRQNIQNQCITNRKRQAKRGLERCYEVYYEMLKDYIPEDITLYGEIIGYVEKSNAFIQTIGQGYDYRCKPGENQLLIYRVVKEIEGGRRIEYNPMDVYNYALALKLELEKDGKPEIANRIRPLDIFYHGKLRDLYPDLAVDDNWHANLLERMKNDTENFGMEGNEPMCRNTVPREGIVIRIDDDPVAEAFKLKCLKFLGKEAKQIDKGYVDPESKERYEG